MFGGRDLQRKEISKAGQARSDRADNPTTHIQRPNGSLAKNTKSTPHARALQVRRTEQMMLVSAYAVESVQPLTQSTDCARASLLLASSRLATHATREKSKNRWRRKSAAQVLTLLHECAVASA